MSHDRELILGLRLEDAVALLFFLINLGLDVFIRGLRGQRVDAAEVMFVIPAVALILGKEVIEHFVAGHQSQREGSPDFVSFVRPYWEIVRDWFPFLIVLLMYYSLWGNATLLLVPHDRDAMLIRWDQWLFGVQPTLWLQRIVSPLLTAWMQFTYAFYLYVIPIVACFIYVFRSRSRFREMMTGLVVISFFGFLGYLIVPAIGPMYTLHNLYTVALSQPLAVLNRPIQIIDIARVRRDCFPSLHVGISFLVWLYARRNSKILFWILAPFILSLWLSTVYLRFHYAVDSLAGLILAPLCFLLANWLYERAAEVTLRVPLPSAWAERFHKPALPDPDAEEPRL